MNRQPHPDGAKAQARQVYERHGAKRAAEVAGVPARTVRRWAAAEGWPRQTATGQARHLRVAPVAPVSDAERPSAKGSVATVGYQPARLLERVTAELWAQLDALARSREAGKARDARETAVVVGILLDKAAALAKTTGAGRGQLDPAVAIARLDDLMGAIEQGAAGG